MAITVERELEKGTVVRPFKVEESEAALEDLRARIRAARFP